jgi:subtilase family serine protease
MPRSIRARGLVAMAVLAVAGLCVTPAAFAQGRRTVPSARPGGTRGARETGAVAKSQQVTLRIYLAPRGGVDALEAAAEGVSTPGSASYRRFLTPAQFRARYAPTSATIASVERYLKAEGLKVVSVEPSGRYIVARGPASAVQSAFATQLRTYRRGSDSFRAPTRGASVPGSIASRVLAVQGLSTDHHRFKPKAPIPPPDAFVNARPCSASYGEVKARFQADGKTPLPAFQGKTLPYAVCGYTPRQFRGAYEQDAAKYTGAGQSVGIVDAYAAPTIVQDANQYASRHGDKPFGKGQFTQSTEKPRDVEECDASGWFGEETLDVEAVHGMAPGARVHYYGSASCENIAIADTVDRVVDDNDVSIVTNSYGSLDSDELGADDLAATEQALRQAAMQGMAFMYSSGDDGDEALDPDAETGMIQTDYPASSRWATAVGGTSAGIGSQDQLLFQTGWGTNLWTLSDDGKAWDPQGFLYGSGGGFSKLFPRPGYQRGVVPAGSPPGRAVPDVALDGDPTTGMLVGETQLFPDGAKYGEYRIGGTSLSSPLMAGVQALTQQRAGGRQGFLNPGIYAAARRSPEQFIDISGPAPDLGNVRADFVNGVDAADGITYSVRTFNQDSSLALRPGWDDVTGVGSPSPRYIKSFG